MTTGLEVINDFNTIVIDSNYSNFMLSETGVVTTTARRVGTGLVVYIGNITTSAINPQVFFRNTNGAFVAILQATYGSTSSFTVQSSAPGTFTYHVFGTNIPPASRNFGLQVFKEDGSLAFDSGSKLLRYETVIQMSGDSWVVDIRTYPLPVDSKIRAACISFSSTSAIMVTHTPFPMIGFFIDSFRVNQNSIDTRRMLSNRAPGQPDTNYPPSIATPAQLIIADVTGYS